MVKFCLFTLKLIGFVLWVAGFFGTLAGIYGLFNHTIGDNRAPIFIIGGMLSVIIGITLIYLAVRKNKKELAGVLFNDWFISLLWPW